MLRCARRDGGLLERTFGLGLCGPGEGACLAPCCGVVCLVARSCPCPPLSAPRFGVNGGGGLAPGLGLPQRLRGWLVDAMSSGKRVQTSPYGS